jgi:hypothetical protein
VSERVLLLPLPFTVDIEVFARRVALALDTFSLWLCEWLTMQGLPDAPPAIVGERHAVEFPVSTIVWTRVAHDDGTETRSRITTPSAALLLLRGLSTGRSRLLYHDEVLTERTLVRALQLAYVQLMVARTADAWQHKLKEHCHAIVDFIRRSDRAGYEELARAVGIKADDFDECWAGVRRLYRLAP